MEYKLSEFGIYIFVKFIQNYSKHIYTVKSVHSNGYCRNESWLTMQATVTQKE